MIYTFIIVLVSVLLIFAVARVSIGDGSLSTSFDKISKWLSAAIANKDKAKPDGSGNLQKAETRNSLLRMTILNVMMNYIH